ncbi:MAG: hypothetical protein N3F63_00905 [Thermoplasmata archaeon]|nr:hypothetical protein [Thermoplasmata archaeon]
MSFLRGITIISIILGAVLTNTGVLLLSTQQITAIVLSMGGIFFMAFGIIVAIMDAKTPEEDEDRESTPQKITQIEMLCIGKGFKITGSGFIVQGAIMILFALLGLYSSVNTLQNYPAFLRETGEQIYIINIILCELIFACGLFFGIIGCYLYWKIGAVLIKTVQNPYE